jgi:glycosyltransferase involved in cell wall biosynthesis
LPSVGEPFGRVLVEAGAAGLAAVSTRVGGTIEILEDGVTGHFVPACEPAPLAERVADLLGDLDTARRMGRVARDRVRGVFGIERMLDRTLDVYRQLVDVGANGTR